MGNTQITQIAVKSVLTAQNPRGSLPFDYTINPYRGCLFGCSYCYASRFIYEDSDKKADWGHWLQVKHNAVDALQRESHKLVGKRVFFSSATDPYQYQTHEREKKMWICFSQRDLLVRSKIIAC